LNSRRIQGKKGRSPSFRRLFIIFILHRVALD
jgi:hypothetical protein